MELFRKIFITMMLVFVFITSCSNEKEQDDITNNDISQKTNVLCDYIFDSQYSDEVILVKSCGIDCYEIDIEDSNNIMRLKTRSETLPGGWIYWGEVKGKFDAIKMGTQLEKLYKGKCYEMRLEPSGPKGEDRKVYHKPC